MARLDLGKYTAKFSDVEKTLTFMPPEKRILLTGAAGFVGSHLLDELLKAGHEITALDNFDPFYPERIKVSNISNSITHPNLKFVRMDVRNTLELAAVTDEFDCVLHLAARAGVRPSLSNPELYYNINVLGTQNLLEFAKARKIPQFVFISSSSVYGENLNLPWIENDVELLPVSPYAVTKLIGEKLCREYASKTDMRIVVLRPFSIYGPRLRPDLAIYKFLDTISRGGTIEVFGDGSSARDYTYVTDIVAGIVSSLNFQESQFEVFNLGNTEAVPLSSIISELEMLAGRPAKRIQRSQHPADVKRTCADISKAAKLLNYSPSTNYKCGLAQFAKWFTSQQRSEAAA